VIEPTGHKGGVIDEARLHRVRQGYTQHQVTPAATRILNNRERHAEIVGGVAGLGGSQEAVHEVDVAHQGGVPEGRVDGTRLPATNERTRSTSPEVGDLLPTRGHRASAQSGDAAAQRVQNMDRELGA
jgi:hypothetical protein